MVEEDIFNDLIEEEPNNKKSSLDVLNELFSGKGIETRTELNDKEIFIINSKQLISQLLEWESLNKTLKGYMTLKISKARKGRLEFVEGFKGERELERNKEPMNKGFFSNLFNR